MPPVASLVVVTDLDSREGLALARNALRLADADARVRVSFLHNAPTGDVETHAWALSRLYWKLIDSKAVEAILPKELAQWIDLGLTKAGPREQDGNGWSEENPLLQYLATGIEGREGAQAELYWALLAFVRIRLSFRAGERGLVLNGRVSLGDSLGFVSSGQTDHFLHQQVVGPFPPTQFAEADLHTLLSLELEKRILPVVAAANATSLDLTSHSDYVM